MQKELAPSPLSFDTSLIKFFCKTPDTEKTSSFSHSYYKKPCTPPKTERPSVSRARILFETDPSFDELSIDLIKTMGHTEDTSYKKEKFDGFLFEFSLKLF